MDASPSRYPSRSDLIQFMVARIAERLDCPLEEINPDGDLMQLGLQSIDAVVISGELEDYIDDEIDPTILLNHRTVVQVVEALLAPVGDEADPADS
jgi:acyl carrier protein